MSTADLTLSTENYIAPDYSAVDFWFKDTEPTFTAVPGLIVSANSAWDRADSQTVELSAAWVVPAAINPNAVAAWRRADFRDVNKVSIWQNANATDINVGTIWSPAAHRIERDVSAYWQNATPADETSATTWDKSPAKQRHFTTTYDYPPPRDVFARDHFYSVDLYGQRWRTQDHIDPPLYVIPAPTVVNFVFNESELYTRNYAGAAYFAWTGIDWRKRPPQPQDVRTGITYNNRPARHNDSRYLPWGPGRSRYASIGVSYPDYSGPIQKPGEPDWPNDQPSYTVMNTVNIVKLPERTPLDFSDLSISHDIDSFAWAFTCTLLNQASINVVKPDSAGPKEIELDINGLKWVFIVERYSVSQKFPATKWQINGVTRTQFLSAPYAPARSKRFTSATSAAQIAIDELLGTGFSVTFDTATPNWNIDANLYQYQNKTPIEVIGDIATAVGAVIIPSRETDAITLQPRYPLSPWSWDSADLSAMGNIIIESMVISMSAQWSPQQTYNAAYVSGINAGRSVNVVRNGTAGDAPAPDTYHVLNLDDQQCIEKGRNILSDSGNQEVITLELPLPPTGSPGLVLPGNLVEYRDQAEATQWRGLVLSTSITAAGRGATKVTQTPRIERHH